MASGGNRRSPERGSGLLLAVISLAILTAGAAASMQRSHGDQSLARTWNLASRAETLADTGLKMTARAVIEEFRAAGSIDSLLLTNLTRSNGGDQYGVWVLDNDNLGGTDQDGDGNPLHDSDGIFRLVSTGQIGEEATATVDALYRVETPPPVPPIEGAVALCADVTDIDRAGNISGVDHNPPPYPCDGSGCDGSPGAGPDRAGLSYNAGSTVNLAGGAPDGNPGVDPDAGIDCAAWRAYTDRAAEVATKTYRASQGPFNASAEALAFGTPEEPRIVLVEGTAGETARFNGNLYGNGILIVRNAETVFTGTFTFAGLVIVEGRFGSIRIGGTSQILGSMMVIDSTEPDSEVEIGLSGPQTRAVWSSQGWERASSAYQEASGDLILRRIAWQRHGD